MKELTSYGGRYDIRISDFYRHVSNMVRKTSQKLKTLLYIRPAKNRAIGDDPYALQMKNRFACGQDSNR